MTPELPHKYRNDEWFKLTKWAPMCHQEEMYWAIVKAATDPTSDCKKRFIPVMHRRAGKDSMSLNALARAAMIRPGLYYYCAPEQAQCRKIIFDNIDRYGRRVIDQAIPPSIRKNTNNAEMKITIDGPNGTSIFQVVGSDNYNSIVGTNPVGIVFSEFALSAKPECWDFFRPILAENNGFAVFPSTPRGLNHFYSMYTNGLTHRDWLVVKKDVTETERPGGGRIVTDEDIENERAAGMSEALIRQEFYCDFVASGDTMLYSMDAITAAMNREPEPQHINMPLIMGVDVARFGDDKTVFAFRRGSDMQSIPAMTFDGLGVDQIVDRVQAVCRRFGVDMVFIDETGVGAGVADYCRRLRTPSRGINFAAKPLDGAKYLNKRAEMHGTMAQFLKDEPGVALEKNKSFAAEASAIEYEYDMNSRIKLMDKQAMKKKLGTSTDFTDAYALTFAFPVPPKGGNVQRTSVMASDWE